MSESANLLELSKRMIQKLHDESKVLQEQALRYSAEGDYEKCCESLQKQRDAISAQIGMVQAAKHLTAT